MKSVATFVGIAAFLVGSSMLSACATNEPDRKEQVSTALKGANIRDVDVDYDKDARVVHLKGRVNSTDERARAEQVAERAVGTSGKVLNEVTVTGVDAKSADDNDGRIKTELKDRIDRDMELKERGVTFDVNNGAVEAQGWVASPAEKNRVSELVHAVPGVRDFANGIEVRPDKAPKPSTTRRPTAAENPPATR